MVRNRFQPIASYLHWQVHLSKKVLEKELRIPSISNRAQHQSPFYTLFTRANKRCSLIYFGVSSKRPKGSASSFLDCSMPPKTVKERDLRAWLRCVHRRLLPYWCTCCATKLSICLVAWGHLQIDASARRALDRELVKMRRVKWRSISSRMWFICMTHSYHLANPDKGASKGTI